MSVIDVRIRLSSDRERGQNRLKATYISCDCAEECSTYKKGKCFCVPSLFSVGCPIGTISYVDGGVEGSDIYRKTTHDALSHDSYEKLKPPDVEYITKIGGKVYISVPNFEINEQGGALSCVFCKAGRNGFLVNEDCLTVDNIETICKCLSDKGGKYLARLLYDIRKLLPEKYIELVKRNPDLEIKKQDFVGCKAKLATCNRSETYFDEEWNCFVFDEDWIVCKKYRSRNLPFLGRLYFDEFDVIDDTVFVEARIKLSEDMIVRITNNNQVTDETELL